MRILSTRAARKGIAGIVGAIIFFGILSTVMYTYLNVQYDINRQLEDTVSTRVLKDVEQQNEGFRLGTMFLSDDKTIGFVVHNTGQELINVVAVFVHEPSGEIANKSDGSKAVFSGNPVFSVSAGTTSSMFNTTVIYPESPAGVTFMVRVLTDKGNLVSAPFPELQAVVVEVQDFVEGVEGLTQQAIGRMLLDFTSFEVCIPIDDNCEPTSSDWVKGWKVTINDQALFRVILRNPGNTTYFLSKHTVLAGFGPMGDPGSIQSYSFHIKEPPTVGDDDGIPYSPDFGIALVGGSSTTLYFGATLAGMDIPLAKISEVGMYWTILTVFSFEDVNENGTYESGIDTKQYAQSLPFQAGVVVEI
ncbi:MAG: hypothetical protein V3T23_11775 [Nitrososphaerales archaeon]